MCGGDVGDWVDSAVSAATLGTVKLKGSKPKTVISPSTYSNNPKEADEKAVAAREDTKKKAQQMLGRKSTILTGSEGLTTQAQTVKKTLLGS